MYDLALNILYKRNAPFGPLHALCMFTKWWDTLSVSCFHITFIAEQLWRNEDFVVAVVQLLSYVQLFVTPWTATHQAATFDLSQLQGLFQWVSSSHQMTKVLEFQLQHQSFQWIFRVDFPWDWLVWSPCNPRDSQESSPASLLKASLLQLSVFFIVQLSNLYMTTGKIIALTI